MARRAGTLSWIEPIRRIQAGIGPRGSADCARQPIVGWWRGATRPEWAGSAGKI
jgi:hypothetical protein